MDFKIESHSFWVEQPKNERCLVKKYGKKFEALSWVPDGSDDHKPKKGYPVISCVALKRDELIPLDFSLFSYNEESFESQNQKLLFHIDTIAHRSKFRGTFVLDREFDRFAIIRHLHQNATQFVIRLKNSRHFYLEGKYATAYDRADLIRHHAQIKAKAFIDLKIKKRFVKKLFTIKAAKVELKSGRIESEKSLTLIRARASDTLTLYLLTNRQNLSQEDLGNLENYNKKGHAAIPTPPSKSTPVPIEGRFMKNFGVVPPSAPSP